MSLWDDIGSQEANLRHVIQSQAAEGRAALARAASLIQAAGRAVFAGIGSGMNACIPAVYYLMGRGVPAHYLDATEAAYGLIPGLEDGVLVLSTRSGETIEVVRLAQQAREADIPIIAVTNEPGSRVGRLATVCLPTYSRWDKLVVISAYGGMVATGLALAGTVVDRAEEMLADLELAAGHLGPTLRHSIEQRDAMAARFRRAAAIYLLGRGPSVASAWGGGLVIQETSRQHTVSMPAGLFRQGPIEVVDSTFRAIIFEGRDAPAALSRQLAEALLGLDAGLLWVGRTELAGALQIPMPDLPSHILPLLEILPCQVLAHDLAAQAGLEPGQVRYIQLVITTEAGLPNAGSR